MKENGEILYNAPSRHWILRVAPHIALKLKRVFGKVHEAQFEFQTISDTLENARDLAWFLERYPLDADGATLAYIKARGEAHVAQEGLVRKLLAGGVVPRKIDLALPLRPYQALAVEMVRQTKSLLLADEMGLGKTSCSIGMLACVEARPALVVSLTHMPVQYRNEIRRFAPSLTTHILSRGEPYDITVGPSGKRCAPRTHRWVVDALALGGTRCSRCDLSLEDYKAGRSEFMPDVVITSYSKIARWAEVLGATGFKSVVFDEVQELRHRTAGTQRDVTAKYAAATHIRARIDHVLGMSGTPIYNFGNEFWNVFEIIRPGALGTRDEFIREWCTDTHHQDKERIKDPKAFGTHVRESGLMLRRTCEDIGRELPPLSIIPHVVDHDAKALDEVEGVCAELAKLILRETKVDEGDQEERGEKMRASAALENKLRQATGVAKAPFVADFVRMIVEGGQPVVLFGWHHAVYSLWLEKLKEFAPAKYTGEENAREKEIAKRRFVDGDTPILIMSLRAGAGLDGLQHVCRNVVFGELDWSPGVMEQCVARVKRDGQLHPVKAFYLVADTGADPTMMEVLGVKRAQLRGVRDPDAELIEKLDTSGDHVKRLAEAYLATAKKGSRAA